MGTIPRLGPVPKIPPPKKLMPFANANKKEREWRVVGRGRRIDEQQGLSPMIIQGTLTLTAAFTLPFLRKNAPVSYTVSASEIQNKMSPAGRKSKNCGN